MIVFQMDIADEARPTTPTFKYDLSGMKQFQFGTVPDADQRRMIRFPDQQLHEFVLTPRIQCGGCFVEDNDVRVPKNNARERKTRGLRRFRHPA